jgi:hypothetical protein
MGLRDAIPVFNGTNPASTQEWVDEVEEIFAPFPQHLAFRTAAARARLAGAAAEGMADYMKRDWSEFKALLLCRFNPDDARVAVKLEIMSGTRYVGGSFMAALDRAVADFKFLGVTFAVSILSCIGRRVPEPVLISIQFSPADDFLPTIAKLRETAKKTQLRADRSSGWAVASDSVALAATTTRGKLVEPKAIKAKHVDVKSTKAEAVEEPRATRSKSAKRRAQVKTRLAVAEEQAQDLAKVKEQVQALTAQLEESHFQ